MNINTTEEMSNKENSNDFIKENKDHYKKEFQIKQPIISVLPKEHHLKTYYIEKGK